MLGLALACAAGLPTIAAGQCMLTRPGSLPPYTFVECSSTTFPNDFPACAIVPNLFVVGDSLQGVAGVHNTSVDSCSTYPAAVEPASIDYWRPKTKPGPSSQWLCCTVTLTPVTQSTQSETYGLRQSNGIVLPGNYAVIGESEASSDGKTIQFYTNNKQYQPLLSFTGSNTPGQPYQSTLECQPAMTVPPPGGNTSGPITLRAAPGNHTDIDIAVFDSDLNPIPGYMHDDPDDSGFTRNYPPGEYTIVVSDFDLVTPLPSDIPDEQFRDGFVMESPNGVACTSPALVPNLSIAITDSVGTYMVPASKTMPFGLTFIPMTVLPPGVSHPPGGLGIANPQVVATCGGASVLLLVSATPGGFPPAPVASVDMDLSALGIPAPTPLYDDGTNGDQTPQDGVYSLLAPVFPGTVFGDFYLPFTVHDALGRSSTSALFLTTTECSPCPVCAADFNDDGGIDGSDVGAFFDAWSNGLPCGDVNADGGADGTDVEFFFSVWENGGC